MSEWQTINTAPKDGSRILAVESFDYEWGDEEGNHRSKPGDWAVVHWSVNYSQWVAFGMMFSSFAPTHWMPLPQPPKDAE